MEGQFQTEQGAPLRIGGWPDPAARETRWAVEIPKGLSYLATGDPDARVLGLEAFPVDQWPPTQIVHPAFQLMVGSGFLMLGVGAWFWWTWFRDRRRGRSWTAHRRLLTALALATPLGFLALETGWIVTEVGRQPWIVYGIMLTRDAVTPVQGVPVSLVGFTLLYAGLMVALVLLLRRLARGEGEAEHSPEESTGARH
jgi:cytochrome d ubiquinol oxidase subunit I